MFEFLLTLLSNLISNKSKHLTKSIKIMQNIYSFLENMVAHSAQELHLEPNKLPYIISDKGQLNLSTTELQGPQISMLVFPIIPENVKQELPNKMEIDFPFNNKFGNFNFSVKKSPSGFNVTVKSVSYNNPLSESSNFNQTPNTQMQNSFETPNNVVPQKLNLNQFNEQPNLSSNSQFSNAMPNLPQNQEVNSMLSNQKPVDGMQDSINSINFYLRTLRDKKGTEINLETDSETKLVLSNEVVSITKPLSEAQITLMIETVMPAEAKRNFAAVNSAEFILSNQFGNFSIAVTKINFKTLVNIKYFAPEKPVTPEVAEDKSVYLDSQTTPAFSIDNNPKAQLDGFFQQMAKMGASDLHLSSTMPPMVRKDGRIMKLGNEYGTISPSTMKELLTSIMPQKNREEFDERHDTDFAYEIVGLARFRANIFMDRKGMGGVFRIIPSKILTAETLGLSEAILDLCELSKGLVVVTGPTGSGKSTTLCAMVDFINRNREDHLITIEDPIEFVHDNKKCLVNQREVHNHTDSFKDALRAALREDPDILLVGEMRDLETISIAIETAETGHLVFGTLHTTTAASTVDRIIDQFPADRQQQIRVMLSESLRGVIAQTLLPKKGGGRIAALEVLIVTPAISNLIREGKTFQIPSAMQTGKQHGMVLLNDALIELVQKGLVEAKDAYIKAVDKTGFEMALNRIGMKM